MCHKAYLYLKIEGFEEEFEDTKGIHYRLQNDQKQKGQKDKQRSTKHYTEDKDRATRTPLNAGVNSCALEWYSVPAQIVLTTTKSDGKLCPHGQHMNRLTISFLIFGSLSARNLPPPLFSQIKKQKQ